MVPSSSGGAPSPPSVASRPVKLDEAPPIRVLLKANFGSVPVEGSDVDSLRLLQASGGKIRLADGKGRVLRSGSGFRLQARKGRLLKLDGVAYEGVLEVFVNPLGSSVIVNELSLETYLKGVVPNELSPKGSSQFEALKALTVAARTFAFSALGQNASRGFDLYTDTRSQVYRGAGSERLLSNQAIEQTRAPLPPIETRPSWPFTPPPVVGSRPTIRRPFRDPVFLI